MNPALGCFSVSSAFIAFSSMPELAQKIKLFFALAPVVTVKHARSPIMKLSFLLDRQFKTFQVGDCSMLSSPRHASARKGIVPSPSPWGLSDTVEDS